jgi:cytochrome c-type biogenesis protein CcmE
VRSGLRFTIALALAVALGGVLLWTSFGGSVQAYAGPEELTAGSTYRLNGLVAEGSPRDAAARAQTEAGLRFFLVDKENHGKRVQVVYRGSVPDTFKDKRELVLTGELRDGVFHAERNSMIALCPSKFTDRPEDTQAST